MPDYILTALILLIICVPIGYGGYLKYRYSQPFWLYKATTKEKWGQAAKIAFFMLAPFLVMAIFFPVIKPEQNNPWWTSLYCVGFWLIIYPFVVLGEMIHFGFTESINSMMNQNIKKWNRAGYTFSFPTILFPNKETQRFFREGFPDEIIEGKQRNYQDLQKEKPIYESLSPQLQWKLNIYGPTKKSPVFYAYFRNNKQTAEEYVFAFGYLENHEQLSVSWNLPNHICGLYLANRCYALFYYGENPGAFKRFRARTKEGNSYSPDAIAWFSNLGGV